MQAASATNSRSVIGQQLRLRLGKAGARADRVAPADPLTAIPVVEVGRSFPAETLELHIDSAHQLLDGATRGVPRAVLAGLDRVSRAWLVRQDNAYLAEIDAARSRLGRPGAHFLSVNYEWGCSVAVGPSPDGRSAQLVRTLDWFTPGLGRHVMCAKVDAEAGPFATLTWPGFTGVLQAMAPGRFSAALNQAPLRRLGGGLFPLDWLASKARIWRMPHLPPLHLLRRVMESTPDYATAVRVLRDTPIAAPATFSLAGLTPDEACVIERTETEAHVAPGPACTTNHWLGLDHGGHARGLDSDERLRSIAQVGPVEPDTAFPWLQEPVLNDLTRLAMVADARQGRLVAQGFENGSPATSPLAIEMTARTAPETHGV